MSITGNIADGAPRIEQLRAAVLAKAREAMGPLLAEQIAYTVATKFSGGGRYLARRSGRTAGAVQGSGTVEVIGNQVRGSFGGSYPSIWANEFGVDAEVHVRRHQRTTRSGRKRPVRAHERHAKLPARHMIEDALRERSGQLEAAAERIVAEVLEEAARGAA